MQARSQFRVIVKSALLAALALTGVQALVGCGEAAPAQLGLGSYCMSDPDCPTHLCIERACSKPCKADTDCGADGQFACGVTATGDRACVGSCTSLKSQYVCADGVPTSCSVAPEHCAECGCPSTDRCEVGVGCVPKRPVGEACASDGDCDTDNCSAFAGICRTKVGAACTTANCDGCLIADGWSFCSRRCTENSQCGTGSFCNNYTCAPLCQLDALAACPGDCAYYLDNQANKNILYCDCERSGCQWTEAPHPLGKDCLSAGDCESKLCDGAVVIDNTTRYPGLCSKPCTSTDACGSGFACAAIAPAHCLPTCTDSCPVGSCLAAPTTEGTTQNVCWAKRQVNATCGKHSDCMSGNCVNGKCALPAG